MMKISKKSIFLSLVILAILALGSLIFMTDTAAAEGGRNVIFGRKGNDFSSPRVTGSASDGVNTVVSYSYPVPSTATPHAKTTRVETESVEEQNDDVSDLTANAVFGKSSFMPSGIVQWILFLIFILIIVLLVRRFWGYERDYMLTPLKHD